MNRGARKVCMIGDFGVGKTKLSVRFIDNTFSEGYLTTIGVRVNAKMLALPNGDEVKLVVWDIAGSNALTTLHEDYLRGAAGVVAVADGLRAPTLATAQELVREISGAFRSLPHVLLVNKIDRADDWEIADAEVAALQKGGHPCFLTSAKDGSGVVEAFTHLGGFL